MTAYKSIVKIFYTALLPSIAGSDALSGVEPIERRVDMLISRINDMYAEPKAPSQHTPASMGKTHIVKRLNAMLSRSSFDENGINICKKLIASFAQAYKNIETTKTAFIPKREHMEQALNAWFALLKFVYENNEDLSRSPELISALMCFSLEYEKDQRRFVSDRPLPSTINAMYNLVYAMADYQPDADACVAPFFAYMFFERYIRSFRRYLTFSNAVYNDWNHDAPTMNTSAMKLLRRSNTDSGFEVVERGDLCGFDYISPLRIVESILLLYRKFCDAVNHPKPDARAEFRVCVVGSIKLCGGSIDDFRQTMKLQLQKLEPPRSVPVRIDWYGEMSDMNESRANGESLGANAADGKDHIVIRIRLADWFCSDNGLSRNDGDSLDGLSPLSGALNRKALVERYDGVFLLNCPELYQADEFRYSDDQLRAIEGILRIESYSEEFYSRRLWQSGEANPLEALLSQLCGIVQNPQCSCGEFRRSVNMAVISHLRELVEKKKNHPVGVFVYLSRDTGYKLCNRGINEIYIETQYNAKDMHIYQYLNSRNMSNDFGRRIQLAPPGETTINFSLYHFVKYLCLRTLNDGYFYRMFEMDETKISSQTKSDLIDRMKNVLISVDYREYRSRVDILYSYNEEDLSVNEDMLGSFLAALMRRAFAPPSSNADYRHFKTSIDTVLWNAAKNLDDLFVCYIFKHRRVMFAQADALCVKKGPTTSEKKSHDYFYLDKDIYTKILYECDLSSMPHSGLLRYYKYLCDSIPMFDSSGLGNGALCLDILNNVRIVCERYDYQDKYLGNNINEILHIARSEVL